MTEALEIDPSRRFQPRARGELFHPGSCAVCGGDDPERTFLDIDVFYDYEGKVYICSECFKEAAKVMGFFTKDEHLALLQLNNDLIERMESMQQELNNVEPLLASLRALSVPVDAILSGVVLAGDVPDESAEGTESGEPEVTEPADEQGSSDSGGTKPRNRGSKPVIQ